MQSNWIWILLAVVKLTSSHTVRLVIVPADVRSHSPDSVYHSVYPSVCRTDGYGTDRRLQEHALFRAKNVLYSFSSKTVRFECIVISALHVHLLSSKTP